MQPIVCMLSNSPLVPLYDFMNSSKLVRLIDTISADVLIKYNVVQYLLASAFEV